MVVVHLDENLVRRRSRVGGEAAVFVPAVRSANLRPARTAIDDGVDEGVLPAGIDAELTKLSKFRRREASTRSGTF
jgi:hypothetical protein